MINLINFTFALVSTIYICVAANPHPNNDQDQWESRTYLTEKEEEDLNKKFIEDMKKRMKKKEKGEKV